MLIRFTPVLAMLACAMLASGTLVARADPFSFDCTGMHLAHRSSYPVANKETVTLKQRDDQSVLVGFPDEKDPLEAQTVSNNGITLVLRAKDLTLQYFKRSGQLYVIHDDGRLTRLACSPAK